jgi:pyridoxal phosphate enzyme (YggS family)
VVVTKTHPIDAVRAVLEAGIRDLGENYVEEATEKIDAIGHVDLLSWHMIGHIQSRKANMVAYNFSMVHSVDSLKLAIRLNRFALENNKRIKILLECNMSGEESKFGFPAFEKTLWPAFISESSQIANLENLNICGLMTMPPLFEIPEKNRPYFEKLRSLRDVLSEKLPSTNWKELSMGTSTDYLVAVEEGATLVRIGTAILGSRSYK